jgi:DNA-binding GntR family transcriptional regulator
MAQTLNDKQAGADVERALEQLRDGIQHGRYVAGQRLVEIDLIRDLDVSRGPVREALRQLEGEGLVNIESNRGASVRKTSRKELADIFEVLTEISVITVRRAMRSLGKPANRKRIKASLEIARKFSRDAAHMKEVTAYMEENGRFWDSIAGVVDNAVLTETRAHLQTLLYRLQFQGLIITDREKWITQHEEILAAMLADKGTFAEHLVYTASESVKDAMLSLSDTAFS